MGSTPRWDSLKNLKIIFELEASFNLVFDLDDLIGSDQLQMYWFGKQK